MWVGLLVALSLLLFTRLTAEQKRGATLRGEANQWFESMVVEMNHRKEVEKERDSLSLEVCELQQKNKELMDRLEKTEGA